MLYENQTYALQWNAIWDTLYFDPTVDVYLYHADNNAPTNKILRVPNDGLMTFSIDEVSPLKGRPLTWLGLVYLASLIEYSTIPISILCRRTRTGV